MRVYFGGGGVNWWQGETYGIPKSTSRMRLPETRSQVFAIILKLLPVVWHSDLVVWEDPSGNKLKLLHTVTYIFVLDYIS